MGQPGSFERLAGRPGELASGEKVDVKVGYGFSAVGAVVNDDPEAGFGYSEGGGERGCGQKEVAEQGGVVAGGLCDSGDGLFRNDEDVGGGLGVDVADGHAEVVFVEEGGWYFAGDDFFEECHAI